MAIQFQEIRQYLARNVRLSICFDGGYYHDYLMISDIPAEKYKDLYVFGIGMVDVEFSMDIYTSPKDLDGVIMSSKDNTMEPAIEIVLEKSPRNIERKSEDFFCSKILNRTYREGEILQSLTEKTGHINFLNIGVKYQMSMIICLYTV